MAELLEDCGPETSGLRDFHCHQLEIYKHQFRIGAIEAEEKVIQEAFDAGFRACLPLAEKVGRLQGALSACLSCIASDSKDNEKMLLDVRQLLDETNALQERFAMKQFRFLEELAEEPSIETTPNLRDAYNPVDMQLLLGEEFSSPSADADTSKLSLDEQSSVRAMKAELNSIADAFERLRDSSCDLLHNVGICDSFLYGD